MSGAMRSASPETSSRSPATGTRCRTLLPVSARIGRLTMRPQTQSSRSSRISGGTGPRNAVEMRKSHSRTRLSRGNAAVSAHIEAVELEGTGSPMSSQPSPTSGEAYCRSASPMMGSVGTQPPPSDGLRRRHVQCAHRVKSCTAAHFVGYPRRRRGICAPDAPRFAPAAPTARSLFGATPIYRP